MKSLPPPHVRNFWLGLAFIVAIGIGKLVVMAWGWLFG